MNWNSFSYNDGEKLAKAKGEFSFFTNIISDLDIHSSKGRKKGLKMFFEKQLINNNWTNKFLFEDLEKTPLYNPNYIKERMALDMITYHSSKIGTEFIKFEILSNRHFGYIDFGFLLCLTNRLQNFLDKKFNAKWQGTITFEQIISYLEISKDIISVPLLVIAIDL